jgi:hypothetical protein
MNERLLQTMYQQWQQGKNDVVSEWIHFVELVARDLGANEDEVIRHLQKYSWFVWSYNE